MLKRIASILLLSLLGALTGCGVLAPQPTAVLELPTLAVLPTNTPPPTATRSLPPTFTPTPTLTFTPTNTPTATPTLTFTPSLTPTATVTPTNTITPLPSNTPLPSATPTSETPVIVEFVVGSSTVKPGESVAVSWRTDADVVVLDLQNISAQVVQSYSLPPYGQQAVPVPSNLSGQVIFRLTAARNGLTTQQSVPVGIDCLSGWFFDPARLISQVCPQRTPADSGTGRYQPFQFGHMVFSNARGLNVVYAMWGGSTAGSYSAFSLTPANAALPAIPSGLFAPQNEFEGVWISTTAATGAAWQTAMGFATNNAESASISLQNETASTVFYIAAGGRLFRLSPTAGTSTGTWQQVP